MAAREAGSPHSATWRMDHSGRRFAPGRKPHWNANFFSRELGVTYKTAWRMAKEIRTELMEQSEEPLDGTVELDESYFGGKAINMHHAKRNAWADGEPLVNSRCLEWLNVKGRLWQSP